MKIGLEVHVALPTKTKLFCSDPTSETAEPNTNICPTCMGFPGSRPVLNKEAVRFAKSISIAFNCKVNKLISFIRKVYFYPDLPKSFQITQLAESIGQGGLIILEKKQIRLRRIQIEEDPAKIIRADGYSFIDFNRSGIPLVEIVTEPDIETEEELRETLFTLRTILYYLGVDINQEIKADLNISLGEERIEVKNVTGIKNLITAMEYEIHRQNEIIKKGGKPEKETRLFDEQSSTTKSSRKKESEEEYGFIFEPDLGVYDTTDLKETPATISTDAARLFAKKYDSNYKTILELIAFDRGALSLIQEYEGKYDFKTIIATLEVIKRFDEQRDSRIFEGIAKLVKDNIDVTKAFIEKLKKREKIEIKLHSQEEIDNAIKEMLLSEKDIIKKYKHNKNVANFIIGMIAKRYEIQPRAVSSRIDEIINKL
jgi:aspartyl-tRNA(Asn)/glutamyl-tRNA(Gln) amidotransferase subunit B